MRGKQGKNRGNGDPQRASTIEGNLLQTADATKIVSFRLVNKSNSFLYCIVMY